MKLLTGSLSEAGYVRLRDDWYRRLAKDGFDDIESPDGRLGYDPISQVWRELGRELHVREGPRTWWSAVTGQHDHAPAAQLFEAEQEHWARCRQYAHARCFMENTARRRAIWRLHVEGATVREIAKQVGMHRNNVQKALTRLTERMDRWWAATAEEREAERDARAAEKDADR